MKTLNFAIPQLNAMFDVNHVKFLLRHKPCFALKKRLRPAAEGIKKHRSLAETV